MAVDPVEKAAHQRTLLFVTEGNKEHVIKGVVPFCTGFILRYQVADSATDKEFFSADKKQQFEIQVIQLLNEKLLPCCHEVANPLHGLLA
jgi:hypothetical protein